MTRLLAACALACLITGAAQAQLWRPGPGMWAASTPYAGPGNVVSGASVWAGLRAYNLGTAGTKSANVCNSGDATCADVNTLANGNFDDATAQGAPLNCGGSGGTCTIKTLYDKSGALACGSAACDFTQATIASRPTLAFNCRNGHACMSWAGTGQNLVSPTIILSSPNTFSTFAVVSAGFGSQQSLLIAGNTQLGYGNAGDNTWFAYGGAAVVSATAADSSWHAAQGVFDSTCDIYVDGSSNTGACGTVGVSSDAIVIGNISGGGQAQTGETREVGIWHFAFSSGQKSAMNSNQMAY